VSQAQRRVGCYAALAVMMRVMRFTGTSNLARELGRRDTELAQFFGKMFTWMDGGAQYHRARLDLRVWIFAKRGKSFLVMSAPTRNVRLLRSQRDARYRASRKAWRIEQPVKLTAAGLHASAIAVLVMPLLFIASANCVAMISLIARSYTFQAFPVEQGIRRTSRR